MTFFWLPGLYEESVWLGTFKQCWKWKRKNRRSTRISSSLWLGNTAGRIKRANDQTTGVIVYCLGRILREIFARHFVFWLVGRPRLRDRGREDHSNWPVESRGRILCLPARCPLSRIVYRDQLNIFEPLVLHVAVSQNGNEVCDYSN